MCLIGSTRFIGLLPTSVLGRVLSPEAFLGAFAAGVLLSVVFGRVSSWRVLGAAFLFCLVVGIAFVSWSLSTTWRDEDSTAAGVAGAGIGATLALFAAFAVGVGVVARLRGVGDDDAKAPWS